MIYLVGAIAVLMMLIGGVGVAAPEQLKSMVLRWETVGGLWAAASLRLIFGAALWYAAPFSRTQLALETLAVISMAAGFLLPVMGYARYLALLEWWQRQAPLIIRVWCAAAVLLGAFVLWSVWT